MAIADGVIETSAPALRAPQARAAAGAAQVYFLLLAALGIAVFALGVANRLTPDLFPVAPPVEFVPPLGQQAWYQAFLLHQQDPIFATCGGTESLAQFKLLYWWEWLRRASLALLSAAFVGGFLLAAVREEFRLTLRRHVWLGLIGLGYIAAVGLLDMGLREVPDLARYNTGQYRHLIDVTFASVALALVMAQALTMPELPGARRTSRGSTSRATWPIGLIALIVLGIASGALFAARDAITVWRTFPGYEGGALPPLDQLTAYRPMWLNFGFNQYMIQLAHRAASIVLGVALVACLISGGLRGRYLLRGAGLLFALTAAEIALGALALNLGGPRSASFVSAALAHEVGAIVLLAAAFAIALSRRDLVAAPSRREGA